MKTTLKNRILLLFAMYYVGNIGNHCITEIMHPDIDNNRYRIEDVGANKTHSMKSHQNENKLSYGYSFSFLYSKIQELIIKHPVFFFTALKSIVDVAYVIIFFLNKQEEIVLSCEDNNDLSESTKKKIEQLYNKPNQKVKFISSVSPVQQSKQTQNNMLNISHINKYFIVHDFSGIMKEGKEDKAGLRREKQDFEKEIIPTHVKKFLESMLQKVSLCNEYVSFLSYKANSIKNPFFFIPLLMNGITIIRFILFFVKNKENISFFATIFGYDENGQLSKSYTSFGNICYLFTQYLIFHKTEKLITSVAISMEKVMINSIKEIYVDLQLEELGLDLSKNNNKPIESIKNDNKNIHIFLKESLEEKLRSIKEKNLEHNKAIIRNQKHIINLDREDVNIVCADYFERKKLFLKAEMCLLIVLSCYQYLYCGPTKKYLHLKNKKNREMFNKILKSMEEKQPSYFITKAASDKFKRQTTKWERKKKRNKQQGKEVKNKKYGQLSIIDPSNNIEYIIYVDFEEKELIEKIKQQMEVKNSQVVLSLLLTGAMLFILYKVASVLGEQYKSNTGKIITTLHKGEDDSKNHKPNKTIDEIACHIVEYINNSRMGTNNMLCSPIESAFHSTQPVKEENTPWSTNTKNSINHFGSKTLLETIPEIEKLGFEKNSTWETLYIKDMKVFKEITKKVAEKFAQERNTISLSVNIPCTEVAQLTHGDNKKVEQKIAESVAKSLTSCNKEDLGVKNLVITLQLNTRDFFREPTISYKDFVKFMDQTIKNKNFLRQITTAIKEELRRRKIEFKQVTTIVCNFRDQQYVTVSESMSSRFNETLFRTGKFLYDHYAKIYKTVKDDNFWNTIELYCGVMSTWRNILDNFSKYIERIQYESRKYASEDRQNEIENAVVTLSLCKPFAQHSKDINEKISSTFYEINNILARLLTETENTSQNRSTHVKDIEEIFNSLEKLLKVINTFVENNILDNGSKEEEIKFRNFLQQEMQDVAQKNKIEISSCMQSLKNFIEKRPIQKNQKNTSMQTYRNFFQQVAQCVDPIYIKACEMFMQKIKEKILSPLLSCSSRDDIPDMTELTRRIRNDMKNLLKNEEQKIKNKITSSLNSPVITLILPHNAGSAYDLRKQIIHTILSALHDNDNFGGEDADQLSEFVDNIKGNEKEAYRVVKNILFNPPGAVKNDTDIAEYITKTTTTSENYDPALEILLSEIEEKILTIRHNFSKGDMDLINGQIEKVRFICRKLLHFVLARKFSNEIKKKIQEDKEMIRIFSKKTFNPDEAIVRNHRYMETCGSTSTPQFFFMADHVVNIFDLKTKPLDRQVIRKKYNAFSQALFDTSQQDTIKRIIKEIYNVEHVNTPGLSEIKSFESDTITLKIVLCYLLMKYMDVQEASYVLKEIIESNGKFLLIEDDYFLKWHRNSSWKNRDKDNSRSSLSDLDRIVDFSLDQIKKIIVIINSEGL